MRASHNHFLLHSALAFAFCFILTLTSQAQLRRPNIVSVKREDRTTSKLPKEKGAVYLEGMVTQPVTLTIPKTTGAYYDVNGSRWLGNVFANQKVQLLAVSEKAYRIRARAKQGQIAGWVRKDAVTGVPDGFEDKLVKFHQRYELVKQLIDNKQVALGMTPEEVTASIGPPDTKSSHLDEKGSSITYEFISYTKTPQTVIAYDRAGYPFQTTKYVEVESGRVTIKFTNNLVTSISETEGLNFNKGIPFNQVPPYLPLF